MLRRHFLALLPAPLLRRFGLAPAAPLADLAGPSGDAAALYGRAFGWAEGLTEDERMLFRQWAATAGPATDPRLGGLLDGARPALAALRAAVDAGPRFWEPAAITEGDLGTGRLDLTNGVVVSAACLEARRSARSGRGRAALDDLFAALALAHRVESGGLLIGRVLECGYEMTAFLTLGWILPALDRPTLDDLAGRLDRLPPPAPASATIESEFRFIVDSVRAQGATLGATIEDDWWADFGFGFGGEEAEALRRITGGDQGRLLDHLEASRPAVAELARRVDLPRPGCREAVEAFRREAAATSPAAAGLADAAWSIRHVVDRMVATRALARAGLALVRDGEAAFQAVADPFGAGPFDLERHGPVCLIRSALRDEGRPAVGLKVGEPS